MTCAVVTATRLLAAVTQDLTATGWVDRSPTLIDAGSVAVSLLTFPEYDTALRFEACWDPEANTVICRMDAVPPSGGRARWRISASYSPPHVLTAAARAALAEPGRNAQHLLREAGWRLESEEEHPDCVHRHFASPDRLRTAVRTSGPAYPDQEVWWIARADFERTKDAQVDAGFATLFATPAPVIAALALTD